MENTKLAIFKIPALVAAAFFVLFFGKVHNASAINAPTTPTSTSNITQTSIQFNWTWGGGDETRYIVEQSSNGITYTVVSSSVPTSTTNYTFAGLSPNTQYWFRVAAATSTSATSTYITSNPIYSLPNAQELAVSALTTSTAVLNFINVQNPSSTLYALGVFAYSDSISGFQFLGYLDQNGFMTSTQIFQTTSTWGVNFLVSGLSPNVWYTFVAFVVNGDGVIRYNSTLSPFARYTLATQVDAPTVGTPTDTSIPITINTTGNSASTTYAIKLEATGYGDFAFLDASGVVTSTAIYQTTSTWGTNFSAVRLVVNTDYQFAVIARNGEGINAATSSLSSVVRTVAAQGGTPGGAIPVNSASQGGVLFNPVPVVSPLPIAVPGLPTEPVSPVVVPKTVFRSSLGLGSKGQEVVALQQKLRELGFFKFPTNTGYYGSVTKAAVIAFQKKYNLKPYPGIVGPLTRAALNSL
jgi:hypothetical protein